MRKQSIPGPSSVGVGTRLVHDVMCMYFSHNLVKALLFKTQIHSLSVAEKEGDNPCRFAVGTGSVESWEQYYVLEATSPEKKEQWVQSIKEILKGQFELLKGE